MNLTRSSFKLFVSKAGGALVVFVGITVFARELSAGQLGVFFLFQTLLYILTIPADLGIRGGVEKRLSEGLDSGGLLASAIVLKTALLAIVTGGIVLARGAINGYVGTDIAGLLIVALVLWEVAELYIYTVRGELRVGETALLEFGRQAVWIGLGAVLVFAGFGAYGIIYGLIGGAAVVSVWSYHRADTSVGRPSMGHARSLFDYSKYHFVSSIGGRVYEWMDVAVIGFFLTTSFVGVYEVAWQVTLLVLMVSYAIATTIFPQISQWNADAETERIESIVSRAIGVSLALSIPAFVGAAVFAEEILTVVFGAEYAIAGGVLVLLMGEKVFQSANDVFWRSLNAIDQPRLAARATVITIAINLVLNVALVPTHGIVGAAVATTAAAVVNTLLHGIYLARFLEVRVPYRLVGLCIAGSALMGAVLAGVRSVVPVDSLPVLVAEIGLGVLFYAGFALVVPPVRRAIVTPGVDALR